MNIELHGFWPERAREIEEALLVNIKSRLGTEESEHCVVTVVSDCPYDRDYRHAPFFRVFSDDKADFMIAAELLRPIPMPGEGMKKFIECVLLVDCIELRPIVASKMDGTYGELSVNDSP